MPSSMLTLTTISTWRKPSVSSSDTRGSEAPAYLPAVETPPSSGMSLPSSHSGALERQRLLAQKTETDRVRSALSSLGCLSTTCDSYADIALFQLRNEATWLIRLGAVDYFLPDSHTPAMLEAAARQLIDAAEDDAEVRAKLFELWLCTRHEKMTPDDREAMLMVYVRKLAQYPKAAVLYALSEAIDTATFFPTWAELADRLHPITHERTALVNALRRQIIKRKET